MHCNLCCGGGSGGIYIYIVPYMYDMGNNERYEHHVGYVHSEHLWLP